ncbi:hypothetical protein [Flammeovirga agarivorans]|uniref:Sulfotransferase domain-containing protein n=1 Tax=Flammeovirga agarivorans TaxID=2726742 RepID=A0A7X8SLM9_9BACT|nr:hypothetical protein [Flammeovirga agarivorans]NLR92511.1 hypothetical protein [Flammeovirga agarivorans]
MKNKLKYDFVVLTPGRAGSNHLMYTLKKSTDALIDFEIFNQVSWEEESFNVFINQHRRYKTLGLLFNRNIISRVKFNFPLEYLIRKFLYNYSNKNQKRGFRLTFEQAYRYPYVLKYLVKNNIKIIFLDREDTLSMIISLLKARKTLNYLTDKVDQESQKTFSFSPPMVLQHLLDYKKEKEYIENHFIQYSNIYKLTYESLFSDYEKEYSNILSFLSLINKDNKIHYTALKKINSQPLKKWVENYDEIISYIKNNPH